MVAGGWGELGIHTGCWGKGGIWLRVTLLLVGVGWWVVGIDTGWWVVVGGWSGLTLGGGRWLEAGWDSHWWGGWVAGGWLASTRGGGWWIVACLLDTSPMQRDVRHSRVPGAAAEQQRIDRTSNTRGERYTSS